MLDKLEELGAHALQELGAISQTQELEAWRLHYLGKKSPLSQALRGLGALPEEERRKVGALANKLRADLERSLQEKRQELQAAELEQAARSKLEFDVTLPGRPLSLGRLHPTTQIIREISHIFETMGFQVIEGPEVEWDYYNFEALNIPPGHPARDMWATFWVDRPTESEERPMLLRTHTSPMQIRVMEKTKPPVRVVVPGRCYRYEATDATHESMFYQVEGLAVDEGITMADLKGTLFEFARRLFGTDRQVRFRCDYFPFVEPGVEMAIDCLVCRGAGCRLCGNSGWLEILGAGMVHPEVLERVGYDSRVYTGYAFGLGVERIPMLRYGIDDIRLFYSNDLRFLRQF
jgi:phenylalanyl-tRNA synthetase alpha chain